MPFGDQTTACRNGGALVSIAALWRFFRRTRKKTAHAAEQDRPDIPKRREDWFEGQLDLEPERLVFIDETSASTNMARPHGRAPQGKWLRAGAPHGHWNTTYLRGGDPHHRSGRDIRARRPDRP
jgi:hypothetical protein